MKLQEKIKSWCKDEKFMSFAQERARKEVCEVTENHRIDPQYEELDEAITWDNRYIVPMMTYLTYRLQLVKLQKNAKNRNRRVWWIFVHVIMREDYTQLFDGKFEKFLTELHDTVMTMLHDEYTRLSKKKK